VPNAGGTVRGCWRHHPFAWCVVVQMRDDVKGKWPNNFPFRAALHRVTTGKKQLGGFQ
jgi:hypothetical protein